MRSTTRSPRLAERLMERALHLAVQRNGVVGDLREEYARRRARTHRLACDLWFWRQAILVYWRFRSEARRSTPALPESNAGRLGIDIISDIRFTFRSFRRSPGFATATVLVLGIGIGAVSLMFSTFNTVVLQPLPFEEPDRLVWVWSSSERVSQNSLSYLDYVDYRQETDAFESLGAFGVFRRTRILTGDEEAQQVGAYHVSANLFSTLGIAPEIGRAFLPEEEETGREGVTMLSHGFWQRRYGGDPAVVGATVTLNGQPAEIVGVMPAGFDYPAGADLWFPLQQQAGYAQGRGNNNFRIVGRLRDGVTIEQAQAQMDVVAGNIAEAFPAYKAGWGVSLVSLHERYFGSARATILMLMGIIALVPLVACANVASLFMARAVTRRTELAFRLALGASRARVIRQLLTESLVVAIGGGAVGLALAYGGGEALRSFAPAALPRLDSIGIDGNVFAFTLVASLLMIPLFGMVPALRATDMGIAETLKVGGGRSASDRRSGLRSVLVVAQVALSLMLMLASGLFLRSFLNLQGTYPGFQAENVLGFRTALPYFKYNTAEELERVWDDVHRRLRAVPGVTAVGSIDRPPVSGSGPTNEVWAAGRAPANAAEAMGATRRFATEGYFDVMRIPLLAGRVFEATDGREAPPVTVINETLAEQFFPGEDPLGKTLVLDWERRGGAPGQTCISSSEPRVIPSSRPGRCARASRMWTVISPSRRSKRWKRGCPIPCSSRGFAPQW